MNFTQYKGFSVLELLFALLVMSIIFCFSYPSFQQSMYKAQRKDALTTLMQLQLIFEQCYSTHHSYKITCPLLPIFPYNSEQNYYSINCTQQEDNSYILIATAQQEQMNDTACAQISINQAQVKTAVDAFGKESAACWST